MNYQKQQILFRRYRTVATICAIFILCANLALILTGARDLKQGTVLLALSAAISFLLYYLPTYLGLTVEPEKRYRWAIRIRWIITGVLLIAGLIFVRTPFQLAHLFLTILALAVVNLIVRRLYKGGKKNAPWIYLISDLILLLTWVNNLGTAATAIVLQSVLLLYTSLSYNTEARWERARSIGLVLLVSYLCNSDTGSGEGTFFKCGPSFNHGWHLQATYRVCLKLESTEYSKDYKRDSKVQ
jgi:hypothetical protein